MIADPSPLGRQPVPQKRRWRRMYRPATRRDRKKLSTQGTHIRRSREPGEYPQRRSPGSPAARPTTSSRVRSTSGSASSPSSLRSTASRLAQAAARLFLAAIAPEQIAHLRSRRLQPWRQGEDRQQSAVFLGGDRQGAIPPASGRMARAAAAGLADPGPRAKANQDFGPGFIFCGSYAHFTPVCQPLCAPRLPSIANLDVPRFRGAQLEVHRGHLSGRHPAFSIGISGSDPDDPKLAPAAMTPPLCGRRNGATANSEQARPPDLADIGAMSRRTQNLPGQIARWASASRQWRQAPSRGGSRGGLDLGKSKYCTCNDEAGRRVDSETSPWP